MDVLSLGALARDAGVNPETIRYYERRGLLPDPPRTPAGYRQYSAADAERVALILRAKDLGFTLAEIGALLDDGPGSPGDVLAAARHRLAELDGEIARFGEQRRRLERLLHACEAGDAGCTSLEPLEPTPEASTR
ncbi:MAG TPA: MerR family transcriptional regulator [Acidimicrobiales bacterium]|nr:MerR family transcriptional regulator [Acidimicrobiales bacterium]